MATATIDDIYDLLDEAEDLDYGEPRYQLTQTAFRLAQTTNDPECELQARYELMCAAYFSGRPEVGMNQFAYLQAKYQENPERWYELEDEILWAFKWMVGLPYQFADIPLEKGELIREQMIEWYTSRGISLRPLYGLDLDMALERGDEEKAREAYAKMIAAPRDGMSNCAACENDCFVDYHIRMGEWEKALEFANKNINGELTCAEVPHRTLAYALEPLAMLGDYETADQYQRRGYRMIRNNPNFLCLVMRHLEYLMHRERLDEAAKMLANHLGWALAACEDLSRLHYFALAAGVLTKLADECQTYPFWFSTEFELYDETGIYRVDEVNAWFQVRYAEIAAKIDARNGNDYYMDVFPEDIGY